MSIDPVLKAIDDLQSDAEYDFDETSGRGEKYREHVTAIRTAYLASKRPTVKDNLTVHPSDGGEFERVARNEEWYNNGRIVGKDQDMGIGTVISVQQAQFIVDAHSWTISELSRAHNADRVADKQRIAQLEAKLETYRHANDSKAARIQKMKEQYEEDARNRKQHITGLKEELDGMLAVNDNANRHISELEETINQLSKADASLRAQNEAQGRNAVASAKHIAELKAQIPKVVTPKPIGDNGLGFEVYQCGCNSTLCGVENYCPECGAKLNWEDA